jgi:hypothetical protein
MIINTVEKIYEPYTNSFNSYKVTYTNGIIVQVPLDEANTDYQAIQEWIADGGTVIDNGGGE